MTRTIYEFGPGMPESSNKVVSIRTNRIKVKYQKLVDDGLYEQQDGRVFTHALFTAIVHFPSKAIWVYTFPIIAGAPVCFIKTCKGGILYKDLRPEDDEVTVDMEEVLDFVQLYLDTLGGQEYVRSTAIPHNCQRNLTKWQR